MGAHTVIQEYESGANTERERFLELVSSIRNGDTLVATEVSRVTRSLRQLCEVTEVAKAKGLLLKFGQLEYDFADGRIDAFKLAMLQITGVFAELERNLTKERINSGLAHAKTKGVTLGRPKKTAVHVPIAARQHIEAHLRGEITVAQMAKQAGLSRPTAYKYIKLVKQESIDQNQQIELEA